MSVTLHEAIEHAREVSLKGCTECHKEHGQLADWLEELEQLRDVLGDTYNLESLKETLKEVDHSCRDISNLRMEFGIDTSAEMSEYIRKNGARMAELMEADREGRCVVLPKVSEKTRSDFADFLNDVFTEWGYSDYSVGINGMSDGERELASAIMDALAKEVKHE